ncbi:MAG TPA: metal-binding protein [Dehalococcoidia bacterium]|nr:metal-binding protein [Dehalococcoidia bacterium]
MPSGKVHDRITLVTAAAAVPLWWTLLSAKNPLAFLVGLAAYLFSGFWLSDDLDTASLCYKRWGLLRCLWWPYRKIVPHRSWLSHGLGVGPLLRVGYFAVMVWAAARGILWLVNRYVMPVDRDTVLHHAGADVAWLLLAHPVWTWYALAGLILGGVAHTIADAVVSFAKHIW